MKVIKQFTCLLVCIVLLSSSFMVGYAAENVIYTAEDLIDFGFDYNSDEGIYTYSGKDDPFGGFSFLASSDKNYPNFNPMTDVPWSSFPQYIKDILSMSLDGLLVEYGQPFRLPFFLIRVNGSTLNIFAGVNVALGQMNLSSMYCYIYGYSGGDAGTYVYPYSCLYRCDYNYGSQSYTNNWRKCEASPVGDKGTLFTFTSESSILTDTGAFDFYFYGANGVSWASKYTSLTVPYNSANTDHFVSFRLSKNGFESGNILPSQANAYSKSYFQYIVPPSQESINQQLQEEENKTSKGILETLKEIPDKIQGFFESLKNYLLYFQDTEPEHVNPFSGILDGISSFFDEQLQDTDEFKSSLNTTFENVKGYIETGSNIINKLLGGVPILNTVLIFFLAFAVIRKVVGR